MKFYILSKCITGYKNIIKNSTSQDNLKIEESEDSIICAIADGHSSDFFTESYKGSKIACQVAIDVLKKYLNYGLDEIKTLLEDKVIQKEICYRWKLLVEEDMKNTLPLVIKYNYFKYGTTLLSVLIKEEYALFIKLGDGDVLLKNDTDIRRVFPTYRKNVVDSMPQDNAHENMLYVIEENKINFSDVILFSDGFTNSFKSNSDLIKNINDTVLKYKKNIFTKYILEKTYEKYLINLSKNNSLDDISIIFLSIL